MNSLRGAKAEEVFNSLLLSGSFLLEEDSDSNKSIKNNKIYDVLFTQYETNSILEIDNSRLINFGQAPELIQLKFNSVIQLISHY